MNDRYLYRAKRADNGEWIIGNLVYSENASIGYEYMIMPTQIIGNWSTVLKDTICQCTGLKDKNGKLIFENDIMVAHLDDEFPEYVTYARVVWNNNGFYTKEQSSEDILQLDEFDQEHFEVCGNLFDNTELLDK